MQVTNPDQSDSMPQAPVTVVRLSSDSGAEADRWKAVRELCCRSANNGEAISAARWPFFGRLWVEPYQRIAPHWTYVAEADGAVVGYLTGCADSRPFAVARFWRCTLPLFVDIALGRYPRNRDVRRFVRELVGLEKGPERMFYHHLRRKIRHHYPAHLHMNVAAAWRGRGVGTILMRRFLGDLGAAGVPGVHLHCGADPVAFYQRQGFRKLGKVDYLGLAPVYLLGRRCNAGAAAESGPVDASEASQ